VVKEDFFTAIKGFYTFTTRSLRARFGISRKPGVSGPNPGDSAPLESSEQIFKEFDFVEIWNNAYVLTRKVHSTPITQQAEQSWLHTRRERKTCQSIFSEN
jgi:hypothetical protein